MYKVSIMYVLNAGDELISKDENSLERKTSGTKVKEVFQRWPQQLHNHHIVISFRATPFYLRDTD